MKYLKEYLMRLFFYLAIGPPVRDPASQKLPRGNSCLAAKFKLYWPSGEANAIWGSACQNAAYLAAIRELKLRFSATTGGRGAIGKLRS